MHTGVSVKHTQYHHRILTWSAVNSLALSTDCVLRTGYFDHTKDVPSTEQDRITKARERFEKVAKVNGKIVERMVSASDDFTMFLWDVGNAGTKPVARMVGHQKQINSVSWSADGTTIASAGWDNHTKLWNARYVLVRLCERSNCQVSDTAVHVATASSSTRYEVT
jgi:ribosome assembly protein 4